MNIHEKKNNKEKNKNFYLIYMFHSLFPPHTYTKKKVFFKFHNDHIEYQLLHLVLRGIML